MSHTPFIAGAYTIGVIVLLWCALAPVFRHKTVLRDIRRLIHLEERQP
jgi:heme exporter protein CcmD